jgi:hypothetical protein
MCRVTTINIPIEKEIVTKESFFEHIQEIWKTLYNISNPTGSYNKITRSTLCNNKRDVTNNEFNLHGWSIDQFETGVEKTNMGP